MEKNIKIMNIFILVEIIIISIIVGTILGVTVGLLLKRSMRKKDDEEPKN